MKKIKQITLKNFKAFKKQTFEIEGDNLLIYGNNGSGKSSIYWALYTFLQSVNKNEEEFNKYFVSFKDDQIETYQSLKNVFSSPEDDSSISIILDNDDEHILRYDEKPKATDIRDAYLASDFINYKSLHKFYNFTNKQYINLWGLFKEDILPYFDDSFSNSFTSLEEKKPQRRNSNEYKVFPTQIRTFNNELENFLGKINLTANKLLKTSFKTNDIELFLNYKTKLTYDENRNFKFNKPEIELSVEYFNSESKQKCYRPQTFLNEAILCKIALSIRFAAIFTRPSTSELKIIVLDDMLLSLEMSNRVTVINFLLNDENLKDFQKIILTHDKGFYNILTQKINQEEWTFLEINKGKGLNSEPKVSTTKDELVEATEFFKKNDFDCCANYLRKKAEKLLTEHLNPEHNISKGFKSLNNKIIETKNRLYKENLCTFERLFHKYRKTSDDKNLFDLLSERATINDEGLSNEDKGKLENIQKQLIDYAQKEENSSLKMIKLLDSLKHFSDRILNPGSHYSDVPLYSEEIEKALAAIDFLQETFNEKHRQ